METGISPSSNTSFRMPDKATWARIVIISAIILTVIDTIYLNILGSYQMEQEKCIIYNALPKWLFLLYEYLIEYLIIVTIGIFVAVLAEHHIRKAKRFFPRTQLLAFTYGAILPVCSCGAVPLIEIMKNRVPLRVIITFIIAAPLLNPYIVMVSYTMLGLKYTLIRIAASFVLAMVSAWLVELYARFKGIPITGGFENCTVNDCNIEEKDIFIKTLRLVRKLIPYILIGGVISLSLEYFNPKQFLENYHFTNPVIASLIMMVIGIPMYVCNGADVILLKPLLMYTDLTLGSAMVFSLTSSVVCVTSIVMLYKFLGSRLTVAMVAVIAVLSFLIGIGISFL
jgi:uncharacterized membrane protein YraQ (UPF0718 family)